MSRSHLKRGPLTIEDLEAGLRKLDAGKVERQLFWDDNVEAFRRTVLFAIRDTSELLLSPRITPRWRMQLEAELAELFEYLEFAERQLAERAISRGVLAQAPGSGRAQIH